jgi:hypothetical protein
MNNKEYKHLCYLRNRIPVEYEWFCTMVHLEKSTECAEKLYSDYLVVHTATYKREKLGKL